MKDSLGQWLLRRRIRSVMPSIRGRLLDIGCGTNQLVRTYGGEGLGVDVYPWGEVDYVVDDSSDLPFEDGSFDTVTILAALNHIPNRAETLLEAHRLLADTGRLIITMIGPRISRLWHFLRKPWDPDQTECGMEDGEVFGFTSGAVRQMLTEAGFEIESQHRFMLGVNQTTVARKRPRGFSVGPDKAMPIGSPCVR